MDAYDTAARTISAHAHKADNGSQPAPVFERVSNAEWESLFLVCPGRWSGVFASVAYGKRIPWQGKDRLAALTLFELDPTIVSVEVMPEAVGIATNGARLWTTPMFRVTRASGISVMDSLRRSQYENPNGSLNWPIAALRDAYAHIGVPYEVLPEPALYRQPRLRNARAVIDGQADLPSASAMTIIAEMLAVPGKHTVSSVSAALPDLPGVKETVFAMATHHWVKLGLGAPTLETMLVTLLPKAEKTRRQPNGRPRAKSTAVFGIPKPVGIHWMDVDDNTPEGALIDWTGFFTDPKPFRR
jgi:hypothetical protein